MRSVVSLVLAALVLVPGCSDPASPATEDESSSSSSGDESSSGGESSSSGGCDESEYGWCTETCIVPTGPEAGNLCDVVSYITFTLGCTDDSCWKAVAEIYGGGVYTAENGTQWELWELSQSRLNAGWNSTCAALPEPSCGFVSYEGCMEATRELDGPDDMEWRDYACREIVSRYPAAGLPPTDWPN